jgi:acetate kinase
VQVLVVNAGSSSLKLRVLGDGDEVVGSRDTGIPDQLTLGTVLAEFLGAHPSVGAAGHRVVHGGAAFTEPVLLDAGNEAALAGLADLAPLHNPPGLAAIEVLGSLRPDLPQVACFDTAFHARMPEVARTYALPRPWREGWGIRRYGFHGLSHSWASRRAGELLGRPREELRMVTAHLGAGASLAAVAFGRSVDTTMGFTPLEGLVMATRSGSVDPGILVWVQRRGGLSPGDVEVALEHHSGLSGLSGTSGDLRQVMASADAGDADARLAYDVYAYRIRAGVAAMVAAMDGIDALVFTGGAGEASPRLRADVCDGLGFLGIDAPAAGARGGDGDAVVSAPGAWPAVVVVAAREDLEIARHVREVLATVGHPPGS